DCKAVDPESRPLRKLQVTQTLDERQADKGKLLLEIKATAVGLIGPLDELLTLDTPGFDITKVDDHGANVSKFDEDGDSIAIVSERSWTVRRQAAEGLTELPKEFHFAAARPADVEMVYQRFQDADVMAAQPTIALEKTYGKRATNWLPWTAAAGGIVFLLAAA